MIVFNNALAAILLGLLIIAHSDANSAPVSTDNVTAQIISEHTSLTPGKTAWVALQLDIRDGWHTYWRNPGDSGQATSIDWVLPDGVIAGEINWPYPERQHVGPVANYGYHGTVLHLIKLELDPEMALGEPIKLIAKAKWLVCKEECIPERATLELTVKTSETPLVDPQHFAAFSDARESLPTIIEVQSGYQYSGSTQNVRFEFSPAPELVNAESIEYFPYDWGVIQAPAQQQLIQDDAFIAISTLKGDLSFSTPLSGVLVVKQADGAVSAFEVESVQGALNSIEISDRAALSTLSVSNALLFAFLGGIILNLMPCVFPVLFMKALNLLSHVNDNARTTRLHGVSYTLGVLVCFALLAVSLIAIKSAGQQVGWGFQLQSPVFVSIIAVIMFVLGLSLSGYLKLGVGIMGAGAQLTNSPGYLGSFFTGVLAVVVATPCTAPFMGPAIGFAFTQPSYVAISVLLALGFGLALPYLLLSMLPALGRHLPAPGLWMERTQQLLAFPMYVSSAWLVWVLSQQSGHNAVFILLLSFILTTFSIWLWQSTRNAGTRWRILGNAATLASALLTVILVFNQSTVQQAASSSLTSSGGNHSAGPRVNMFNQNELDRLLADGRPAFVNMTAAWCITCLANEKVALSSQELATLFDKHNITYLKGDWTNQDEEITQFLQKFGRNSVPLYVYYPPNSGEPRVLPQILTVATIVAEMNLDDAPITLSPSP